MIFNMVGGGGGEIYSIIAVTYPEGSVCTCTNGTKTLKAKDTSGKALFNVPSAGTWTVSITDGSKTISKTVNISTYGQIESVTLGYGGNVISAIGSFTEVREDGTGGITVSADGKTTATTTGIPPDRQAHVMYFSDVLFDLSKYSTLKFKLNLSGIGSCEIGFYSADTSPYMWENNIAVKDFGQDSASGEYSIDLSSVTSSAYFGIGLNGFIQWEVGTKTAVLTDVNLYE